MLAEVGKEVKGADEDRKIEGAESKGEELRKVAGKAAEVGSSRQRMDRARGWGKRSPCAVQGVGSLAGWWQEAEGMEGGRGIL